MPSKLKISDASKETPTLVRWANEVTSELENVQSQSVPQLQKQANTTTAAIAPIVTGTPGGTCLALDVAGASISQVLQATGGVTYDVLTISYTAPLTPNFACSPDYNFAGIFLVVAGYQGGAALVKLAEDNYSGGPGGSKSFTVNVFPTTETVTFYFVAKNFLNDTVADWTSSPSVGVVLDGSSNSGGVLADKNPQPYNPIFNWSSVPTYPGWGIDSGVTEAFETGASAFMGTVLGNPKLTCTTAHTGIYSLKRVGAVTGDTFTASVWSKVSGGSTSELVLTYYDNTNALLQTDSVSTTSTTWTNLVLTSAAPATSLYLIYRLRSVGASGVVYFQTTDLARIASAFENAPVNTSGSFTSGTNPLTSTTGGSANHATISIAANTVQFGSGQVAYNSGSITPLLDSTQYFVYADDPAYRGGAVTYVATTNFYVIFASNGRVYFGTITTPVFGGGGTGGAGGGGGGGGGGGNRCPPTCI